MQALGYSNGAVAASADSAGSSVSEWVMVAADPGLLESAKQRGWTPIHDRVEWTDERTPLLGIVRYD